jgi:hypothetical protein
LRPVREVVVCLALSLGALLVPAIASAADTTINFDNLPSGTTVTNQYSSEGVTFGLSPRGNLYLGATILSDPLAAHSAPNVLDIEQGGSCGGVPSRDVLWGEFSAPRNHVSLFVGDVRNNAREGVELSGYDIDGNPIPAASEALVTSGDSRVDTAMSIVDPNNRISFFEVQGPPNAECLAIDDLSFDAQPSQVSPNFGLTPQSGSVSVLAGRSESVTLVLHRTSSSKEPIHLSATGLPQGVSESFSENPIRGGDGSQIAMTLTAAPGAPAAQSVPVTITAPAGSVSHSATIQVTVVVQTTYGLRIKGIEITQGIQTSALPQRGADPSAPVPYSGVKLVYGKPTVVRVYADAPNAPLPGVPAGPMTLSGYDESGRALPGSPLETSFGPSTLLDSGSSAVLFSERASLTGGYEFVIPPSWLASRLTLTATLSPSPPSSFTGGPPAAVPCTDPACVALATFTLTGIPQRLMTGTFSPDTVQLAVNGKSPNVVNPFWWASYVLPVGVYPASAAGTIDITWITQGCPTGLGNLCEGRGAQNSETLSTLEDFASHYDNGQGAALVGVSTPYKSSSGKETISLGDEGGGVGEDSEGVAVVDANRPLTDVAHELGHMFGLHHASPECGGGQDNDSDDSGGQKGEAWPPDEQGYIGGIGLNVNSPFGPPYEVVARPPQFFDFMSYCAGVNPKGDFTLGNANAWISVRNWDYIATLNACQYNGGSEGDCAGEAQAAKSADCAAETPGIERLLCGDPFAVAAAARAARARAPRTAVIASHPGQMRVYGYAGSQGGRIAVIDPTPTGAPLRGLKSPYTLQLRGRGGRILARSQMLMSITHVDGVAGRVAQLRGTIPQRAGATALALLGHGKLLTITRRPAHRPMVALLAPRGARRVRGALTVRWRAHDPDRVHLTVSVDFSSTSGRVWRTVYEGPNTGQVSIPRTSLSVTRQARVRLRVNDTFDQVTATSRRFTIASAPPAVRITTPTSAALIRPGATMLLSGVAFGDTGHALAGPSLTWYAGNTRLGSGNELLATLPAETTSITLAADYHRQVGSATLSPPMPPSPKHHEHKPNERKETHKSSGEASGEPPTPGPWPLEAFALGSNGRPARLYATFSTRANLSYNAAPSGQLLAMIGFHRFRRRLAVSGPGEIAGTSFPTEITP